MFLKSKLLLAVITIILIPSIVYAADIDIVCNENNNTPTIIRNTDPLFTISNFLPGNTESGDISITNNDPVNPCVIVLEGRGDTADLTDVIGVYLDGNYIFTLSEFIDGSDIEVANVNPLGSVSKTITLEFYNTSGNEYSNKDISFDILINTQWGDDTEENGEIAGVSDKRDGEVLGASTTLPATGASIFIIIAATTTSLLGQLLICFNNKKKTI